MGAEKEEKVLAEPKLPLVPLWRNKGTHLAQWQRGALRFQLCWRWEAISCHAGFLCASSRWENWEKPMVGMQCGWGCGEGLLQ